MGVSLERGFGIQLAQGRKRKREIQGIQNTARTEIKERKRSTGIFAFLDRQYKIHLAQR